LEEIQSACPFCGGADYMALGDWRLVTDAGRRNLHIKLLHCLEDHENLVTSYKEDEEGAVLGESRYFPFSLLSFFAVLDINQTIKCKTKFTPQIAWKSTIPELEQCFGVRANKAGGNSMKVEKFIFKFLLL
jgi:hypothetical protein